jgi:hypothetical protein
MAEGLTPDLLWAAFWIWLLGFWILSRKLSIYVALVVSLIKVIIPTIYFAFFFDGSWTFLDDFYYQSSGEHLLDGGYNPITVLVDPKGLQKLFVLGSGNHFLYHWLNLVSQYLFGKHYYSAIFINIFITYICAYFLLKISDLVGFSNKYKKGLIIFYLLQWELLAWSSFISLKDILISLFTIASMYFILAFFKTRNFTYLLFLSITIFCFFWIRFYIPLVFLISIVSWLLMSYKGFKKYLVIGMTIWLGLIVINFFSRDVLLQSTSNLYLGSQDLQSLLFGVIRMSLTPQPWSIEPSYTFLFIPSILHWLFLFPTIWSGYLLWHHSKEMKLLIIYLIIVYIFYGVIDELQGPRHRVQIIPINAWLQFHFVWSSLAVKKYRFVIYKQGTIFLPKGVNKDTL